jgi:LAO/AO transport system kinase
MRSCAPAARAAVTIMAAVFDRVIVETVGVGQSEGDVADLVDTLVFVAQPAAGDTVQFLKAGVLELPDIFAVGKADLGALAERTARELESALALGEKSDIAWIPPVVLLSARDGTGIDALEAAIGRHRAHLASDALAAKRRRGRDAWLRGVLARRYGSYGLAALGGASALAARLAAAPDASGFALAEELSAAIERALRGGGA